MALTVLCAPRSSIAQQAPDVKARLKGLDENMAQLMKDWDAPGTEVGIVVKDLLVFAKGYGYRDYGKKLPYTPTTTQPIASNTKLFMAVAVGMLVEEGKLRWDEPIKRSRRRSASATTIWTGR